MNKLNNEIIWADYRDIADSIPPKSIDLIMIDPPYNVTNLGMDKGSFDYDHLFKHCTNVLKPTGWLFAWLPIEKYGNLSKYANYQFRYIWHKTPPTPNHGGKMPLSEDEICCAFTHFELKKKGDLYMDKIVLRTAGKGYDYVTRECKTEYSKQQSHTQKIRRNCNGGYREGTSILKYAKKSKVNDPNDFTEHPTQKPLKLYEKIINAFCAPDGLVYDPLCGSGSTPLACRNVGRNSITIEKELKYVNICKERLSK